MGDIFDQLAKQKKEGDIFDQMKPTKEFAQAQGRGFQAEKQQEIIKRLRNLNQLNPMTELGDPEAYVNKAKAFLSDAGNAVKGMGSMFVPNSPADVATAVAGGPLGPITTLPAKKMLEAYNSTNKQQFAQAEQQRRQGDVAGSAINYAGAAVPITGPLTSGVYEANANPNAPVGSGVGLGASRILQAMSMAPKGGAIPNPVEALAGSTVRGAKYAQGIARDVASDLSNSVVRAQPSSITGERNPGLGVTREGISGSLPEVYKQSAIRKAEVGKAIEQTLSDPAVASKAADVSGDVLKPIQTAKNLALKQNNAALFGELDKLENIVTREGQVGPNGEFDTNGPQRPLDKMTPLEQWQLKRMIGKLSNWEGTQFDKPVNAVRRQIYAVLDKSIEAAAPKVSELNQRYSDLSAATKGLKLGVQKATARPTEPHTTLDVVRQAIGARARTGAAKVLGKVAGEPTYRKP